MAVKYVATTGNNGNTGGLGDPWLTIAYAVANISAGDTLYVRGGTYAENLTITTTGTDWTIGSGAMYVCAYPGETVWVQPSSGGNAIVFSGAAYHIWENIGVDGINLTGAADAMIYFGGSSHHIRWMGTDSAHYAKAKNAYWSGFGNNNTVTYIELRHVEVYDGGRVGAGGDAAHGVYFGGTNNADAHIVIDDVVAYGFTGRTNDAGIQIYSGSSSDRAVGITINECTVYGNSVGMFLANSHGGITVTNTAVYSNTYSGVVFYNDIDDCTLYNNVIHGNGEWGVEVGTGGASLDCLIKNTAITSNTSGPIVIWSTSGTSKCTATYNGRNGNGNGNANRDDNGLSTFSNEQTGAPSYVDSASADFRLLSGSPYRDTGTTLASVTSDAWGNTRPQGSAYDIGYNEYPVPVAQESLRVALSEAIALRVLVAAADTLAVRFTEGASAGVAGAAVEKTATDSLRIALEEVAAGSGSTNKFGRETGLRVGLVDTGAVATGAWRPVTAAVEIRPPGATSWADITTDVYMGDGIEIEYGCGQGPLDLVANSGSARLSLLNDPVGTYSPSHTSALANWAIGLPMRIVLIGNDGSRRVKFWGKVDEIDPDAGTYGPKRARVTLYDYIRDLTEAELREIRTQATQSEVSLLQTILAALPATSQPPATSFAGAVDSYVVALDNVGEGDRAAGLVQDVMASAFGAYFQRGDGTHVYADRVSRSTRASRDTFTAADFAEAPGGLTAPSRWGDLWNKIVSEKPNVVTGGSNEVLASEQGTDTNGIAAGATVERWLDYHDPNDTATDPISVGGTSFVDPVISGTDYVYNSSADGTGSNLTSSMTVTAYPFAGSVKFSITNGSASTAYRITLQLRGRVVRRYKPTTVQALWTQSYGTRTLRYAPPYQTSQTVIGAVGSYVLGQFYAQTQRVSEVAIVPDKSDRLMGHAIEREPWDRITVQESVTGISTDVIIRRVRLGLRQTANGLAVDCAWGVAPYGGEFATIPTAPTTVEYLVVAGGGGGGASITGFGGGGGGGGGGVRTGTQAVSAGVAYTVTVGAGGSGRGAGSGSAGGDGGNSVFDTVTSTGGGGGGQYNGNGRAGGSGGGGGYQATSGGAGTAGQGYDGAGSSDGAGRGGCGGGAAGPGGGAGGVGGDGVASSITGSTVLYGAGGAGWAGTGGAGGGGAPGSAGTTNCGAGGGAGNNDTSASGAGGSGVVVVRYPDTYAAASATTGTVSVTTGGGFRVYTFTGSGTITW